MTTVISYLNATEQTQYDSIIKCRELGRELNQEELMAKRLLGHDWTHAMSDSARVAMAGAAAEKILMEDIEAQFEGELKDKFLNLFTLPYEELEAALDEYRWVRQVWNKAPGGMVGFALEDIDPETRQRLLETRDRLNTLLDKVEAASACERLLMTDDCIDFRVLREHAVLHVQVCKTENCYDSHFFFGAALPDATQDLVDALIREHKADLIEYLEHPAADKLGLKCSTTKIHGNQLLVRVTSVNNYRKTMGFFMDPTVSVSRPRRVWVTRNIVEPGKQVEEPVREEVQKETQINPLDIKRKITPALSNRPMAAPTNAPSVKKQKKAPVKRKQFETIRMVKN